MNIRTPLPWIGATSLVLALTACGEEPASPSGGGTASPTTTPSPVVTTDSPGGGGISTLDDLQALLLTLDDLPSGYSIDDEYAERAYAGGPGAPGFGDGAELLEGDETCAVDFGLIEGEGSGGGATGLFSEAGIEFSGSELGPYLLHTITLMNEVSSVEDEMSYTLDLLDACRGEVITLRDPVDDLVFDVSVAPTSYPRHGDQTFAWTMTMELQAEGFDLMFEAFFVMVQVEATLSMFGSMALEGDSYGSSDFDALINTSLDRLYRAL